MFLENDPQQLRGLLQSAFDAVYVLTAVRDSSGAIVDFRFADLNAHGVARMHRTRDEIVGKTLTELSPPRALGGLIARCARVIESRETWEEETAVTLTDGTAMWVRRHAVAVGDAVALTSRDITREKQAAEALAQSNELLETRVQQRTAELTSQILQRRRAEDRFNRLFESGLLGICISDLTGKTLEINDAFAKMLGFTREELLSGTLTALEMMPPEYTEISEGNREALKTKGVVMPSEREFFRKDGTRVQVMLGVALLGSTEVLVCTADLSETRLAKTELGKLEEEIRDGMKKLEGMLR